MIWDELNESVWHSIKSLILGQWIKIIDRVDFLCLDLGILIMFAVCGKVELDGVGLGERGQHAYFVLMTDIIFILMRGLINEVYYST